ENCPCCKSACCCSRQGSADGIECCQADCGDCQAAHGYATAPGENCNNASGSGRCDTQAVKTQPPLEIGFCCEATTDECVPKTTKCECDRRNGDYDDPCSGTYVPDSGDTWSWNYPAGNPDCANPSIPCCPCGGVCCLGEGDECCDAAQGLCCRGSLGQTCCDGVCCLDGEVCCDNVCCEAGQICVDGICQEGCTQNSDCQRYYFNCGGTVYGPYNGAVNCANAATSVCPGPPTPPCYTVELDERYCCDGVCQDVECSSPASLLALPKLSGLFRVSPTRAGMRWRKLWQRAVRLPRPWDGPGSALKFLLSLNGINASPTCGCNKKAQDMDSEGCWWSFVHRREIVAFMAEEAAKRKLNFPVRAAEWLVILAVTLAAVLKPVRWTLSRRSTQGEKDGGTDS
ncbi:MAG: hypothetical protein EBT03_07630, partial [Betaproteobacteria bacterium]|nr:hypothetical protein [Betaproteobacteria bacterium]